MSSFRDVRGFQCIRSMAAEGETLFFLRVRVEVGEGENGWVAVQSVYKVNTWEPGGVDTPQSVDSKIQTTATLSRGQTWGKAQYCLPHITNQKKWTQPYFTRKDSTYTAIIMLNINYHVWTSNSQTLYNEELW